MIESNALGVRAFTGIDAAVCAKCSSNIDKNTGEQIRVVRDGGRLDVNLNKWFTIKNLNKECVIRHTVYSYRVCDIVSNGGS